MGVSVVRVSIHNPSCQYGVHYKVDSDWLLLAGKDVDVVGPNGLVCKFRKCVFAVAMCKDVLLNVQSVPNTNRNRKDAAGKAKIMKSGTVSLTPAGPSAWLRRNPVKYGQLRTFVRMSNTIFQQLVPQVALRQRTRLERSLSLHNTAFSGLTVNRTFRMACHVDRGNLLQSLSLLTVLTPGPAAYLLFPRYKLGVAVGQGDIIVFDGNEPHCNGKVAGPRISCVFFTAEASCKQY